MKIATLFLALLAPALAGAAPGTVTGTLTMDNDTLTITGELSGRYLPWSGLELPLSPTRPAGIVKEPKYLGTPLYGVVRLGNGPRAETRFVVDRADDAHRYDNRVYFDRNQNGDFTDDGDGQMERVGKDLPGALVGPHHTVLPASWGDGARETASSEYALTVWIGSKKPGGPDVLLTQTAAVRTGYLELDGKPVRVALLETACDGIFDIAKAVEATAAAFPIRATIKTMKIFVDADGNGEFGALEQFDATLPFQVGATTYQASATADGAQITFTPTDKPAQVVKVPVRATPKDNDLLPHATVAPDFTVTDRDGRELKLSDFRGKIVVLDFWATWCIPCIRSMPHVQKTIASAAGGADIVWLGVCVWDDLASFKRWIPLNDAKYNFTKVFDPAGKDKAASVASRLYRVTGIPTLYVIDREGRIVEGLMGYLGDDDDRLAQALRKSGAGK